MSTAVMHLRARASGPADGAALRRLASGWLAQLEPQDHGLPHDAIVLVRSLHARADAGPGSRAQAWRKGADLAWARTLVGAARLVPGQAVPAAAAAVWCADPADLLVNLLHDLARGNLAQTWWWPLALRSNGVAGALTDAAWHCLQRHARQLPAAVLQLPPAQVAAAWAMGTGTQQQGLDQALAQHFGVHGAWFESRQPRAAVERGGPSVEATNWVALCRQIAIDPTPLRQAPAAHTAISAGVGHAAIAAAQAAPDEPAQGEPRLADAEGAMPKPAVAPSSARPRSRPPPRRLREDPAATGNADLRHASEPADIVAGSKLRPEARATASAEEADAARWPQGWPARRRKPAPAAPTASEPMLCERRPLPAAVSGKLPHPASAPWRNPLPSGRLHSRYAGLLLLLNAALAMGLYGDFSQPRLPGLPLHPWHWLWLAARQLHGPAVHADPLLAWLHDAGAVQTTPATAIPAWRPDARTLEPWLEDTRPWVLLHQPHHRSVVLQHPAGFTVARLASADDLPALWTQLGQPPLPLRQRRRLRLQQPTDPLHDLWPCLWARLALALRNDAPPARQNKALARWATAQAGWVEISATRVRAVYPLAQWPLALRLAGLDRNPGWIPAAACELRFDFE